MSSDEIQPATANGAAAEPGGARDWPPARRPPRPTRGRRRESREGGGPCSPGEVRIVEASRRRPRGGGCGRVCLSRGRGRPVLAEEAAPAQAAVEAAPGPAAVEAAPRPLGPAGQAAPDALPPPRRRTAPRPVPPAQPGRKLVGRCARCVAAPAALGSTRAGRDALTRAGSDLGAPAGHGMTTGTVHVGCRTASEAPVESQWAPRAPRGRALPVRRSSTTSPHEVDPLPVKVCPRARPPRSRRPPSSCACARRFKPPSMTTERPAASLRSAFGVPRGRRVVAERREVVSRGALAAGGRVALPQRSEAISRRGRGAARADAAEGDRARRCSARETRPNVLQADRRRRRRRCGSASATPGRSLDKHRRQHRLPVSTASAYEAGQVKAGRWSPRPRGCADLAPSGATAGAYRDPTTRWKAAAAAVNRRRSSPLWALPLRPALALRRPAGCLGERDAGTPERTRAASSARRARPSTPPDPLRAGRPRACRPLGAEIGHAAATGERIEAGWCRVTRSGATRRSGGAPTRGTRRVPRPRRWRVPGLSFDKPEKQRSPPRCRRDARKAADAESRIVTTTSSRKQLQRAAEEFGDKHDSRLPRWVRRRRRPRWTRTRVRVIVGRGGQDAIDRRTRRRRCDGLEHRAGVLASGYPKVKRQRDAVAGGATDRRESDVDVLVRTARG